MVVGGGGRWRSNGKQNVFRYCLEGVKNKYLNYSSLFPEGVRMSL